MAKHVKTATELAPLLDISREELQRKWINRPDWPAKTVRGWDIKACQKYMADSKRQLAERTTGVNSDVKRRKLLAEAESAEIAVEERKGKRILFDEHLEEFCEYIDLVKSPYRDWESWVMTDGSFGVAGVEKAREFAARAMKLIQEKLRKAKDNQYGFDK